MTLSHRRGAMFSTRAPAPWAGASDEEFSDWRWQVRHRLAAADSASEWFELTPGERLGLSQTKQIFRFGATPYYASLASSSDPTCPIRRQILPQPEESVVAIGARKDPLGEEPREAAPNLIHRYRDRALLLVTDRCPVYCRFCTRRRIVGRVERQSPRELLRQAFEYIASHEEISEVILSGGDPLMLADSQLDFIFRSLRQIRHVQIIRVHTRMPVTCPMRVTPALVDVLKAYPPVYLITHFNVVEECTDHAEAAAAALVEAGVVVYNQTVLLRGINADVASISELNRRLVAMRVRPYYLHQCDMAEGIEHFRTPLSVGVDIVRGLRGHVSGLMVPHFCVDVPGGAGKVTMQPSWIVSQSSGVTRFQTYSGEVSEYVDPEPMCVDTVRSAD